MGSRASHEKPGPYDHHLHMNQSLDKAFVENEPLLSHLPVLSKPRLTTNIPHPLFHQQQATPSRTAGVRAQTASHSPAG